MRDNNNLADKQLRKEVARKMNNPSFFTDVGLQVGFIITL